MNEAIMALSDLELRRYNKQIQLSEVGEKGQLKLKNSKILVIGAGGMGTPVLQYLAAAGVGVLGICDSDYVNETNFHRQIMYGASDLGKLKTIVAKEKLTLLNSLTNFNIHNIAIKAENVLTICNGYDVIVDCSNNKNANEIIYNASQALSLPLVLGIQDGFKGSVVYFLKCGLEFSSIADQLEPSTRNEKGILGVISGLLGSLQANLVTQILLEIGDYQSGKLITFDALNFNFIRKNIT
jgi:adenylyltransferase/sulfurtransferase